MSDVWQPTFAQTVMLKAIRCDALLEVHEVLAACGRLAASARWGGGEWREHFLLPRAIAAPGRQRNILPVSRMARACAPRPGRFARAFTLFRRAILLLLAP